jgi:hypothetical protein
MLNTTDSLPVAPAAAEQDASFRSLGCAIASKPETGPHSLTPFSASPSSVLQERMTPRLTVTDGGSAGEAAAIGAEGATTGADAEGGAGAAADALVAGGGASARAETADGAREQEELEGSLGQESSRKGDRSCFMSGMGRQQQRAYYLRKALLARHGIDPLGLPEPGAVPDVRREGLV